jgi:hypothetical protein
MKPGKTAKQLRELTDEELAEFWAGWKPGSSDYYMAEMEVRRRQRQPDEIRGWIAIAISACALALSLVALFVKAA